MLNNATIDKLLSMRFSAMADAFRIQQDDPSMKELDFDERFGLLVDAEYSRRKSNRLKERQWENLSRLCIRYGSLHEILQGQVRSLL